MRKFIDIITLSLLAIALSVNIAGAAPYDNITLHKLTSSRGYMPSTTYTMVIDKYGFAWIGSRDGLFRYDGYDIVSLSQLNEEGELSNVWNVFEDGDRLIVNSTEGMFTLDINNYELESVQWGQDVILKHIYKKREGGFYFGTDDGIIELNDDLQIVGTFGTAQGLSHNLVRSIYEDNDSNIWVGTYDGLNMIDAISGEVIKYNFMGDTPARNDLILSIVPNSVSDDTTMWIGTGAGLVKFNRISGVYKKWNSSNSNMSSSALKPISRVDNKLWLGTNKGLNIFDIESETFTAHLHDPDKVYSICSNQIHKIWTDSSNTTWIVTNNGINYVNHESRHVRHIPILYMEGEMVTSTTMRSTINSIHNGLWVTSSEGLFCYDSDLKLDKVASQRANELLPVADCGDITKDRFGRLWIGTLRGLVIYDPRNNSSLVLSSDKSELFKSNYISRIVNNNNKGDMYVSEWAGGMFRIPEDYGVRGLDSQISKVSDYSSSCIVVLNDWIWIGVANKLVRVSADNYLVEDVTPVNEMLGGESIESLFLHDGVIYCGTKGGILTYDIEANSCGRITMIKDNRYIINICKDVYGNIWASDDRVMYRITSSGRIIQFPIDAYSTMQFITKSSCRLLNNGDIAFGGDNGFVVFSPDKMGVTLKDNRLAITYLGINNDRRYVNGADIDDKVVLNHDEQNITIGFSSLNYSNTRLSNYRYRLKGIDKDWNYITNERNDAIYTNIPPGEYLFELCCDNSNGEWTSDPVTLMIEAKSHILLHRNFIVLYVVLVILAIVALLYFYTKHIRLLGDLKVTSLEKEYIQEMAKSKSSFFTNLSHEIRTPLNLITPTIKKVLGDSSIGEENQKLLTLAEENSNRLLRLLNQLLDFRDTQNGDKSPMRVRRNDLKQIVRSIYTAYENQANDSSIDYKLYVDDLPILFYFDRDKMESVIYNLLSNAFKYTPRGGYITVELHGNADNATIEVRNSGVGIAESELPHIFEKFYRAEYFRDRSEGAGIGLSIVSEFVELHSGKIEVESIPNDHTTFRVILPLVISQPESGSSEANEERLRIIEEFEEAVNQRDDKSKVLYVDDNSQILEMVSIILSNDYTVITASDGEEGFEKCRKYHPDIIITDIMMPGSDGIELCKMIKATPEVADIPIIAMTAKSQVSDQIVGVNAGVDSYLTKPINVELIHATIEQLLRRSEEHKEQLKRVNNFFNEDELTSQDKNFMDRVMTVVYDNISDPQFSVDKIAEELNVSNASLYRKVKQLAGVSTNELIKKVRLSKAKVLMQHNYGSLSEIAYKVGFSSPSYFSKCYKVEYGCAPRDTKQ